MGANVCVTESVGEQYVHDSVCVCVWECVIFFVVVVAMLTGPCVPSNTEL